MRLPSHPKLSDTPTGLEQPLTDAGSPTSSNHSRHRSPSSPRDPLTLRVAIQRDRLVLLTVLAVSAVVALTLGFSRRGVVIETFERRAVSIADQEKLLETYNSYSGTITAFLERPLSLFTAVVVQIAVLRLLTRDVLLPASETQWRVGAMALVLGAAATYLLANGLSAVNVQVRELPIRSMITAADLAVATVDPSTTSTFNQSLAEDRPGNPTTNTILRNLILPRATATKPPCYDMDVMDDVDDVLYRLPQRPWMKDLLPQALAPTKSLTIAVSKANAPANDALLPEQFPMNASLAADLLLYSLNDPVGGSAWGRWREFFHNASIEQFLRDARGPTTTPTPNASFPEAPTARLTRLLPPSLTTTEREDRAWFLKHSGPTMYDLADADYKNASLRSWNMTFSHVDIAPGSIWVDAVTIEREMATPRLQTNTSQENSTTPSSRASVLMLEGSRMAAAAPYVPLRKAGDDTTTSSERVDVYAACAAADGSESWLTSSGGTDGRYMLIDCLNQSTRSLLVVGHGRRLVADAVVEQPYSMPQSVDDSGWGVASNVREIVSVTVARISWTVQDLSTVYNAKCEDANEGSACLGLDVALPHAAQRLVVGAHALPVTKVLLMIQVGSTPNPLPIVSVRRPQFFDRYKGHDGTRFIGDVLLPHNVRNLSISSRGVDAVDPTCQGIIQGRLAAYVDNHVYMESTLQSTYTAAAFFLFQNGITHDVVNQTWTPHQTVLAFAGNTQSVDVYVYVPWLNVLLTLAGCALLTMTTVVVVLWPIVAKGSDPLAHITAPHAIASILLNENAFPPLLLARTVVDTDTDADASDTNHNADAFCIQSLSLQRKDETSRGSGEGDNGTHANGDAARSSQVEVKMDP